MRVNNVYLISEHFAMLFLLPLRSFPLMNRVGMNSRTWIVIIYFIYVGDILGFSACFLCVHSSHKPFPHLMVTKLLVSSNFPYFVNK
jgi:hypothetical protein